MRQAPLAAVVVAVGAVAIGDQPAEDGVAEQIADFLVAAAADVEDGGGAVSTTHSQRPRRLPPRRLIGVDDAGQARTSSSRSSTIGSQAGSVRSRAKVRQNHNDW